MQIAGAVFASVSGFFPAVAGALLLLIGNRYGFLLSSDAAVIGSLRFTMLSTLIGGFISGSELATSLPALLTHAFMSATALYNLAFLILIMRWRHSIWQDRSMQFSRPAMILLAADSIVVLSGAAI